MSAPSPLWYAARGAGTAAMILLTAALVMGVGTSGRWEGPRTPRFVTASLHRAVSLISLIVLTAHVVTTVADPFAGIGVGGALVPFTAQYRPLWLGLGVVAAEILVALVVTSLLRPRIGPRTWRLIHWAAYASWPLAIVHGLGTGSDAQAPWMVGLTAACVAAVAFAVVRRLVPGRPLTIPLRALAGAVMVVSLAAVVAWAVTGPLRPGWAARAGTPAALLTRPSAPPAPASLRGPFSDGLVGTMVTDAAGRTQVALRDVGDPSLTFAVQPPAGDQTLPVLTVARGGRTVCTAPASTQQTLYAVCGATRVVIQLLGDASHLTGRVTASGPLG